MPAARSLAPFRSRAFVFVWLGAMVSNIGTWMETTALSFYVAERATASASGLVAAAGFLPGAILGPVGGAGRPLRSTPDHDRRQRDCRSRRSLRGRARRVGSSDARKSRACSLVGGCVNASGSRRSRRSCPTSSIPRTWSAIGLSSTSWNLGRIVGPTAAAAAITLGGISTALWTNAASFGAVVLAILLARVTDRRRRSHPLGPEIRRRCADLRPHDACGPLDVAGDGGGVRVRGRAVHRAHRPDGDERAPRRPVRHELLDGPGVGAVVAGASVGSWAGRLGLRRFLVACVGASGPALVLYGAATGLGLAAIGVLFTGGCYMAALSTCTSVTQRSATSELRGRAMVINNFLLGAAYPAGLMLQARLADAWSLRAVTTPRASAWSG
ncbi:MAG: MFS transporter [Ilumatobacteraceae bacterium]